MWMEFQHNYNLQKFPEKNYNFNTATMTHLGFLKICFKAITKYPRCECEVEVT